MLLLGRALIGLGCCLRHDRGIEGARFSGFLVIAFPLLKRLDGHAWARWVAVTATLPGPTCCSNWLGWRELFALCAGITAASAVMIYLIVPEAKPVARDAGPRWA